MFGIGSTELIVILVVALIVIGPAKLPEMAKSLGKALGEFRRVSTDVKRTIEMEAEQADQKSRTDQAKKELFPEQKASQASQAAQTPQASQEAPKPPAAPAEVAAQAADEPAEPRNQEPVAEAADAPVESVAKDKA
jgi:sec-independent protein translocase protein TatB